MSREESIIVPQVIAHGAINEDKGAPGYFIMQRLDVDFGTYIQPFSGVKKA